MKNIILILVSLFTIQAFAQTDSIKSKITGYSSIDISLSTGNDFLSTSYPAIETGIVCESLGLGVVVGRGNFVGMANKTDNISNYYYEGKVSGFIPLGNLTGSLIFGYGGYFKTQHMFIEYGGGISYTCGNISYGVTCSSWGGITYMTPSLTINY